MTQQYDGEYDGQDHGRQDDLGEEGFLDDVLSSLGSLDELPVADHVAVFEAAHERLRGALSDAAGPAAS